MSHVLKKLDQDQKSSFRNSKTSDSNKTRSRTMFEIKTAIDGYNSGRTYRLQASSEVECAELVALLAAAAKAARRAKDSKTHFEQSQARVRAIYRSGFCQGFVALLIMAVRSVQ